MNEQLEVVLGGSRYIWGGGQIVNVIDSVSEEGVGGSFETKNADLSAEGLGGL